MSTPSQGPGYLHWEASRSAHRLYWIAGSILPLVLAALIFCQGLGGGFLFDDFPNIVDNVGVQPHEVTVSSMLAAALSSPSSELKRPLASLSFAGNFVMDGLNPGVMKATNVAIHIINGALVSALVSSLLAVTSPRLTRRKSIAIGCLITFAWLIAPINVTSVLYIVQRMESLANIFVLIGLLGYIHWRRRHHPQGWSLVRGIAWITFPACLGLMAKETAVLLPLYALCVEITIFRFRDCGDKPAKMLGAAFVCILALPVIAGAVWLGPHLMSAAAWETRDFTLATRLLSEPRVLVDYICWTIFPYPSALSFYHDDFAVSGGWFDPWTTIPSMLVLVALLGFSWNIRFKRPRLALGIGLFFACHALTATVLPLELVYEHRNYFASIGVILAVADLLTWLSSGAKSSKSLARITASAAIGLVAWSCAVTAYTVNAWNSPLKLAEELGQRGPASPRAQYELGRAYIIASHYDSSSPYAKRFYAPLERAASLPHSSILPEQALIFMSARMKWPIEERWWQSIIAKLEARPATIQDESSLQALSDCLENTSCTFQAGDLQRAFNAAAMHSNPSARLLAIYARFAWSTPINRTLAMHLQGRAVDASPAEPIYRISLARMATTAGHPELAREQIDRLRRMNALGRLDADIAALELALTRSDAGRTSTNAN